MGLAIYSCGVHTARITRPRAACTNVLCAAERHDNIDYAGLDTRIYQSIFYKAPYSATRLSVVQIAHANTPRITRVCTNVGCYAQPRIADD